MKVNKQSVHIKLDWDTYLALKRQGENISGLACKMLKLFVNNNKHDNLEMQEVIEKIEKEQEKRNKVNDELLNLNLQLEKLRRADKIKKKKDWLKVKRMAKVIRNNDVLKEFV